MSAQNQSELDAELKTWVHRLCQKNFSGAGELLREAAEGKAKQLAKVRKELEQLTEETVSSFRLAGDTHSNNGAFDEALIAYEQALACVLREITPHLWAVIMVQVGRACHELGIRAKGGAALHYRLSAAVEAYRRALEVQTRWHLPQDWARTQAYLGTTLREQGVRIGGEAGHRLLEGSVEAYRRALEVQTRWHLPQDWAWTQSHLGTTLREQGVRIGGEAGHRLLEGSVEAYRRALEVQTRWRLPQDWAWTQSHLGIALREQGIQTEGEAGRQLLEKAIAACQGALEVQTPEALPWHWEQTQYHLIQIWCALEDWSKAATGFVRLLQIYPDNAEAYYGASMLYHEKLFAFEEAFVLSRQWFDSHPKDGEARSQLAEQCFTTGRFAEAIEHFAELLANPDLDPQIKIPLQAFEIAALLGLNQKMVVSEKFERLSMAIAHQPGNFVLEWAFAGSKYFIARNECLMPYREWLLAFFIALEAPSRDAILNCLGVDIR
ncbi:hypothetical protein [Nitrosococcus watsonii]|uniref:Uncharacterized protein n=1 Tax=Nitrosococcus watsoni (strain C-113) TaxID=105559 RepID=D8KBK4_NITWC|nr:hypothetical protein [Nitrosococcus watsonii]ADJ29651.1 conserved hypothetical protein [Nitrosococcus watsonii C-113]